MPTAETTSAPPSKSSWSRGARGARAGRLPAEAAAELAARTDVDLHRAVELLTKGCSPELALADPPLTRDPRTWPLSRARFAFTRARPGRRGSIAPCSALSRRPHTGVVDLGPLHAPHVRADAARRDPRLQSG